MGTEEVDAEAFLNWMLDRVAPIDAATHSLIDPDPTAWDLRPVGAYRLTHYEGWRVQGARRGHHTVCFIQDGSCTLRGKGVEADLSRGSAFYIPCDYQYSIDSPQGMEAVWLHFAVAFSRGDLTKRVQQIQGAPVGPLPPTTATELAPVLDKAVRYLNHPRLEHTLLGQAALQEVLAALLSSAYEPDTVRASRAASALHEAKRYIELHVSDPITLDQLSEHVYMSKYHLTRLFKETYGLSPIQYQTKLRMEKAEKMLRSQDCTVYEAALSCGYNSIQSFSRVFRQNYGASPGKYRDRFLNREV